MAIASCGSVLQGLCGAGAPHDLPLFALAVSNATELTFYPLCLGDSLFFCVFFSAVVYTPTLSLKENLLRMA